MHALLVRRHSRLRFPNRTLRVEPLEERRLLSANPLSSPASEETPWHNGTYRLDVHNDGTVTTADMLSIVNRILSHGAGPLPVPPPEPVTLFYDTNGDNRITMADVLAVVNGLLTPPEVTLTMLTPFTVDLTPEVTVVATPQGTATLPDGSLIEIDIDFDNDGDFSDPGERGHTQATLYQGRATFNLNPGLTATPDLYQVRLQARVRNSNAVSGTSAALELEVDNRMSDALKNYVNAPSTYDWEQLGAPIPGANETPYLYYVLRMTSQTWRSEEDVNLPEWSHWMEVYVPFTNQGAVADLNATSLLFIRGGNNASNPPNHPDGTLSKIATDTQSVVTVLRIVPNQDVIFSDETQPREEDEIIAYTLDKYLANIGADGNETWPVLLPMVKSAVRAMDTVQAFIQTLDPLQTIDDFVVSGESKRGWTTWLTAAVDDRVRGIMPGVFDNLNQAAQMVNHYAVLGKFSEQVHDYTDLQIFERILTPEAQLLGQIVDPYTYLRNGRFDDMPKLILNSAGDEFFVPDSSRFYFQDLPGEQNYLRYIPNTGHGLDNRAVSSRKTFYNAILNDLPLPQYSWTVEQDGSIHVQTQTEPTQVILWQKINSIRRDFRNGYTSQIFWFPTTLVDQGGGTYVGNVNTPPTGATAYLIELTFPNTVPGADPYVFTTEARIKSPIPLADWPYATGLESAAPPSHIENETVAAVVAGPLAMVGDARNAVALGVSLNDHATQVESTTAANEVQRTEIFTGLPAIATNVFIEPVVTIDWLAFGKDLSPQARLVDQLLDESLDELFV